MNNTRHNHGPGRRAARWLACIMVVALAGCGGKVSQKDQQAALKVMDRFRRYVQQNDYERAMKCMTSRAQQRVRRVGGANTPLDSFFKALLPMISQRTKVEANWGKVWVTHTYGDDTKLLVGITEFKGEGWLITSLKGDEWGI